MVSILKYKNDVFRIYWLESKWFDRYKIYNFTTIQELEDYALYLENELLFIRLM